MTGGALLHVRNLSWCLRFNPDLLLSTAAAVIAYGSMASAEHSVRSTDGLTGNNVLQVGTQIEVALSTATKALHGF